MVRENGENPKKALWLSTVWSKSTTERCSCPYTSFYFMYYFFKRRKCIDRLRKRDQNIFILLVTFVKIKKNRVYFPLNTAVMGRFRWMHLTAYCWQFEHNAHISRVMFSVKMLCNNWSFPLKSVLYFLQFLLIFFLFSFSWYLQNLSFHNFCLKKKDFQDKTKEEKKRIKLCFLLQQR
jgi:hypothetical protein